MPSQQRIVRLQITRLKNLQDVTINFEENKRLTAILGPNGFGKSTVLHALSASFQPTKVTKNNVVITSGEDRRFVDFFPNTPHGTWSNMKFTVVHFYREKAETRIATLNITKGLRQWIPLAAKLPQRETHFVGVSTATPAIELDRPRGKISYTTHELSDADSLEIKQKAGYVLSRDYTRLHHNLISTRSSLIGVEFQGVNYSALSMGAGEQRLFHILRKVKSAGDYALILIDEIDLLMHTDALHRLIEVLNEYANSKKLQIIFTTHRESIVHFEPFVAIRHLYRSPIPPNRTFCFEDTKPDALYRLTGIEHRPLQISCEDDVASTIIEKVSQQIGVGRFVEISRYGSASNCFTLAAALLLSGKAIDKSLFVLDGDNEEATAVGRVNGINRALSGTEVDKDEKCKSALSKIVQFMPIDRNCPEHVLHSMVASAQMSQDEAANELIQIALEVAAEPNPKLRLKKMIVRLGGAPDRTLARIVDLASKSEQWLPYTGEIRDWLTTWKPLLMEENV